METPTPNTRDKKILFVVGGIVAAIATILLATNGKWIQSNLLTVSSLPITVSTDQNNYTAIRGAMMPVTLTLAGNSEKQPVLGIKITLAGVPSYARLENSSIEIPAGVEVDQAIVSQYEDYRIILLYGMRVAREGAVVKLNFKIDNVELPKTPVRVRAFNESGSGAQLVSEIATLNNAQEYVSYTIDSGTAFTILPSDATATPALCTSDAKLCSNGTTVGRTGPNCSFPLCPGETATPTPMTNGNTNSPVFGGTKNVGNLPVYDPTGAGKNRLLVQSVEALGTDRSSTIALRWQPVITVKTVQYDVYRAKYKNCGATTNCYQSGDFYKVASTVDSPVAIDATAQPGQQYIYAIQSVIDGEKSLLSNPSATVAAGNDTNGYFSPSLSCIPYSSKFPVRLSSGTTGSGAVVWASSNTNLVTVEDGMIKVASSAETKGGIVMVNSTQNNSSTTHVVFVAPRGDTDCGGTTNALDANNVANGWGIGESK